MDCETKVCSKCEIEKPLIGFYKAKKYQFGVSCVCKVCKSSSTKTWIENNKDRFLARKKVYRISHKEELSIYDKAYRAKNKEKIAITRKKNNKINKERNKLYRKANRETTNKQQRQRLKTDHKFKLKRDIAHAIRLSLKGNKNGNHWENLVGYTLKNLIRRLKTSLPDGYNWNDYVNGANLHIDHIIPISAHNFIKPDDIDFKRCWALKNLRLIPAKENLSKGAKINHPFQQSLIF